MNFKKIALYLSVAILTLLSGLAWVVAYRFFLENETVPAASLEAEKIEFDINDPESVLPIDYEEDKLSYPKEDENNPEYFDPEGRYFVIGKISEGFEDFDSFFINNNKFDSECDSEDYGETIAPSGYIQLKTPLVEELPPDLDPAKISIYHTEYDNRDYLELIGIKIEKGHIHFATKSVRGITYSFEGNFLVDGNFYTVDKDAKVLKGKLVTMLDGYVIAESEIMMGWELEIICTC